MPARHRELLAAMGVNQLTVTKHPEGSLLIFPRPAWEQFRDRVAALPMDSSGQGSPRGGLAAAIGTGSRRGIT